MKGENEVGEEEGKGIIQKLSLEEKKLYEKLFDLVEKIKMFYWNLFQSIGVDGKGKMPPFFLNLKDFNAYHMHEFKERPECFAFNNEFIDYPEVVCHEYTHAVLHHSRKKTLMGGEAGAINEAIADIFGIIFKQNLYQIDLKSFEELCANDKGAWKVGNLRQIDESFTTFQLKETYSLIDNGHVHYNSRLISHAFFLASQALGRQYDIKLAKIWFEAARDLPDDSKTFNKFIELTLNQSATPLIANIKSAWEKVKIKFPTNN